MAKLLFCEDDPIIRKLIRVALRGSSHEVVIAHDGVEGLERARSDRPAVVFTDLAMPGMDGFALCEAIHDDADLRDIPVVVITASAQRWQLEEAKKKGAAEILLKPFSVADLRATVERHVR